MKGVSELKNLLSFNFFKTISLSLSLTLVGTSSLLITTNYQFTNTNSSNNNKLSGFHITVKENNKNLINEANTWNQINNNYQDLINNDPTKLITAEFNDWSDLINQNKVKPSDDNLSKEINNAFVTQLQDKTNHILPDKFDKYFPNNIVGRSVAKRRLNNILDNKIFGDVYVNYHDYLPAKINNGLFATIDSEESFENYFSIPYSIKPSKKFFDNHKTIDQRVAVLPLNDDNPNEGTNQSMIVMLVKNNNNEKLSITTENDKITTSIFDNDVVSYALLNHNPSDGLNSTHFTITVNNTYEKNLNLTNNISNIQFNNDIDNTKSSNNNNITTQYLVKHDEQGNNTLVVMNAAVSNVKITFNEQLLHQSWRKWSVDPQTLQKLKKDDKGTSIRDGDILSLSPETNFQVYCIALDTDNLQRQIASEQYVVVYKGTTLPSFPNCSSFFQETNNKDNDVLAGFKQYLTAATSMSNSIKVEDLQNNAGEFLSWFVEYQTDIAKKNYVNYLKSNDPNNPWNVNLTLSTKTLVNHWNIIVISGLVFGLLIIIPIIGVIIRKKKYLK